jgi:hypothetical protein
MAEYRNPTRVGYRVGRSGGDANMSNVPYATGSVVGDVVVVMCFVMSATIRVNVPAGWSQVGPAMVDGARTMQLLAHRLTEADLAVGAKSFTLTGATGVTWSSMTLRDVADPSAFVVGAPALRAGTSSTISAPSVTVPRAGDLVLGLLAETSAGVETEAEISVTGATKWFFQPHQTTLTNTHLVTFVDTAAAGPTSTVNAVYPSGSAGEDAIGVQVVLPGSEIVPPPMPSSLFAGTFGFGSTWLTMGARSQNVRTAVRVDATPANGGATIVSAKLATPDAYGWVACRVDGLTPNVTYNLVMVDVETGTALATVQATTTGGIRSDFKVVTSSCQKSDTDAPVYATMAAENAAFFSHQGDLHYQDASTESSWRFGLNANMARPAMKALLAVTPTTYRWDNHDWGGNASWRESPPKGWAPQAIRNLMGAETFTDPSGLWRTWTHNGVRFIDTDQWTLRDQADTTPETNFLAGKTMLGPAQRAWLFDVLGTATEPLIVWFSSFPLYGNYVTNGRWGNFRDEAAIIDSWFGAHEDVRARVVAVGGDSHDIRADDGANTMWKIPSLNASPINRNGDAANVSSSSPWWNIFQGPATVSGTVGTIDTGVYSLLSFDWNDAKTQVTFTWQAKRTGGAVIASWSKVYGEPADITSGVTRLVGGLEQPVAVTRLLGGVEVPVTVERYVSA